jgi:hypothetical protein
MKLITNFKDYYDFVQGEYGIDPKAVYERVCMTPNGHKGGMFVPEFLRPVPFFQNEHEEEAYHSHRKEPNLYRLAICGIMYYVAEENGTLFHGPRSWANEKEKSKGLFWFPKKLNTSGHLQPTDVNEKHKCPVILMSRHSKWEDHPSYNQADVLNLRLKDFQFAKVIPPKDMFLMLTNFLLKDRPKTEKPVDPKDQNKQRIVAHGFDLKSSFRKTK